MIVEFTEKGWDDLNYWLDTDLDKAERIRVLIKDCMRSPFKGIGKPEALKFALSGYWSRRIDQEHRLVYSITGSGDSQRLCIVQCRFHYK